MIERMGKRRRSSSRDSFLTQQYGGMPVWGLFAAGVFMLVAAAVAVPQALAQSQVQPTREPRPIPTLRTNPELPVIGVIGDSYTAGSDMNTGEEWPALLDLGVRWSVKANGGTGYLATNPEISGDETFVTSASKISTRSDVVVFFGSRNDLLKGDPAPAMRTALQAAAERAPDAQIIIVGPAWVDSDVPDAAYEYRDILRAEAVAVGATWVDPIEEGWFFDNPELIGSDGVHPTDAGMQYLADRFGPILIPALG